MTTPTRPHCWPRNTQAPVFTGKPALALQAQGVHPGIDVRQMLNRTHPPLAQLEALHAALSVSINAIDAHAGPHPPSVFMGATRSILLTLRRQVGARLAKQQPGQEAR